MDPSLAPLSDLLGTITARLAALESAAGIVAPAGGAAGAAVAGGGGGGGGGAAPDSPAIADWKNFLKAVDAASKLADDTVSGLGAVIRDAFGIASNVVLATAKYKKPKEAIMADLFVNPFKKLIGDFKASVDRASPDFNQQSAVMEGLNSVQWVAVPMSPVGLLESFLDGATFYLNKVRREFKEKDQKKIEFCNSFTKMLKDLIAYVKNHHKAGLSWNPRGDVLEDAAAASVGNAASPEEVEVVTKAAPPPMAALFAEIGKVKDRQKGGKTAGLRHVTKDMKSTGAASTVPADTVKPKAKSVSERKVGDAPRRPPKFEKVQRRYFVENHVDQKEPLQIDDVTMKDEIMFYNNENLTLIVNSKIKAISIDKCKNCKVIIQSCLSSVEIINCKRIKFQVKGTAPSIAVDKTDGCVIYQSLANIDAQITVSKISECNISWPVSEDPDSEWHEKPIPEQFVARLVDGEVHVEVSELYSS